MNIAVVIPTYNEKETLPSLIEKLFGEIRPLVDEMHVIIIDDLSLIHISEPTRPY